MKKHFLLPALVVLAISNHLYAGTVTAPDAHHVATNFFKTKAPNITAPAATLIYTKISATNTPDFYVFDMSPAKGFVIVAGDDNVMPVLAYSTTNVFRTDFSKTGLNHWISRTAANIELALRNNAVADTRIQEQWTAYRQGIDPYAQRSGAAGPLCTTTWDQENDVTNSPPPFLYNLLCPYNATDSQRTLTGCEATAMSQIMKYWNYPAKGTGSYSYADDTANGYSYNYGIQSSNFAAHIYQWDSMPTVLDGTESLAKDSAVDVLMYDCAVSIGMDFGDDNQDGSGANALIYTELEDYGDSICVQYALVKYFGYDADTIRGVLQSDYNASGWTTVIEHEINMGRPVLYEGNDSAQGGHAWVCDGYDATDKLHMNWGWGGFSDGYFAINNLTTPGNFNPIDSDDALIGIMPKLGAKAGISNISESYSFSMYPNPAANEVVLIATENVESMTWNVKNTLGQTLISGRVTSQQIRIDLTNIANGIYLVELQAGDKSVVKKLVVRR
jgi:hypothetical protein